ncbi:MAG: hypothetical protein ACI9P5_002330 [Saprospiraceae bacterium]|jgi:hypothetical protein|tara:strand:- start:2647 stop:3561 length:915 start_codon:yes stop_codon:yes gene_type:complete
MTKYLFFLFAICSLTACKNDKIVVVETDQKDTKNTIPTSGEFNHDDISFAYHYDKSKDETKITIKGKTEESYVASGKVEKYFFSDLNADDKDEAFIVLTTIKGQSQVKSFSILNGYPTDIYINEVADAPTNTTKTFTGQYGQLIEKMEVKTPDNKVIKKEVRYNLVAGEAGLSLKPQGWTKEQLKTKSGQYKTGMYGTEKYYNKLYVNESETGEWIVDIKVKDSKTENNVCEFQSIGEFINKDLLVPLNFANDKLDGILQIRFVGQSVIVYTQNRKNGSQMAEICNKKGNLSGNYSKLKVLYEE